MFGPEEDDRSPPEMSEGGLSEKPSSAVECPATGPDGVRRRQVADECVGQDRIPIFRGDGVETESIPCPEGVGCGRPQIVVLCRHSGGRGGTQRDEEERTSCIEGHHGPVVCRLTTPHKLRPEARRRKATGRHAGARKRPQTPTDEDASFMRWLAGSYAGAWPGTAAPQPS